mmetsp:Transcript_12951/g.33289  ORF Transcript_12951/g.33289 Transcript_12951/m.33289 type:complete len:276 (+) Transcript_12951:710-1537(+)
MLCLTVCMEYRLDDMDAELQESRRQQRRDTHKLLPTTEVRAPCDSGSISQYRDWDCDSKQVRVGRIHLTIGPRGYTQVDSEPVSEHENEQEGLREKINALEFELGEHDYEMDCMKEELEENAAEIAQLKGELEDVAAATTEKLEEYWGQQVRNREREMEKLRREVERLQRKLDAEASQRETADTVERAMQDMRNQLQAAIQDAATQRDAERAMQSEAGRLKGQLHAAQSQVQKQKDQLQRVQKDLEKAQRDAGECAILLLCMHLSGVYTISASYC